VTKAVESDEALKARLIEMGRGVNLEAGVPVLPEGEMPEGVNAARRRGMHDCFQDRCENCPFASVGGLDRRSAMKAPGYVKIGQVADYLDGYRVMARELYGSDWETCEFSWQHALTIGDDDGEE
jgi:hypothetical protein